MSLKRSDNGSPWSLCRRPWTVMYFTANGRALPCCIAPFSQRGYENYTLGDATQQTLREIWTRPGLSRFPRGAAVGQAAGCACAQLAACAGIAAAASVAGKSAGPIAVAKESPSSFRRSTKRNRLPRSSPALPRHLVDHVIVADGGSTDGTRADRARRRRRGRSKSGAVTAAPAWPAREAAGDADIIVFMDGDGADDPSAIEDMVAALRSGRYDFVIGSRTRGKREPRQHGRPSNSRRHRRRRPDPALYGVRYTRTCAPFAPSAATPFLRSACAK